MFASLIFFNFSKDDADVFKNRISEKYMAILKKEKKNLKTVLLRSFSTLFCGIRI